MVYIKAYSGNKYLDAPYKSHLFDLLYYNGDIQKPFQSSTEAVGLFGAQNRMAASNLLREKCK